MPSYLTLTKESVLLTVPGDPLTQIEDTHWLGTERARCAGEGCQRCAGGNEARRRYIFGVYLGGALYRLALPEVAYELLQKTLGRPPTLANRSFAASRVGTGGNTRYKFVASDGGSGVERVAEGARALDSEGRESPTALDAAASLRRAAEVVERLPLRRHAMFAKMVLNVADLIRSDYDRERDAGSS